MNGILYGIGVGPGDPELMTLKALNKIKESDVIAIPDSGSGEGVAIGIVKKVMPEIVDKETVELYMPMTKDKELLLKSHKEASEKIIKLLKEGKSVSFLTLGDPTVYSTYIYIHKYILETGLNAEIIPGVPSFCAVAAKLNISLIEGSEPLHIIPATYKGVTEGLSWNGNKVLMKTGRSLEKVKDRLKDAGLYENAKMVENCGMDNEKIYNNLNDIGDKAGYFSIIIAKDKE